MHSFYGDFAGIRLVRGKIRVVKPGHIYPGCHCSSGYSIFSYSVRQVRERASVLRAWFSLYFTFFEIPPLFMVMMMIGMVTGVPGPNYWGCLVMCYDQTSPLQENTNRV